MKNATFNGDKTSLATGTEPKNDPTATSFGVNLHIFYSV